MRVLVTWGSERGGTEGIARTLADALRRDGIEVEALAPELASPGSFDAVIVGGALYANRWHRKARRFVRRHLKQLRRIPVWFFSSGPLDDSADCGGIAPTNQVTALMARVGARDHVTFGGRLAPDARGFPASAMAKQHSGDWRNPARIRAWADQLARELPTAQPEAPIELAGGSALRLAAYAGATAALLAASRLLLLTLGVTGLALALHAVAAAAISISLALHYFKPRGAREPLRSASLFAAAMLLLDAVVLRQHLTEPRALTAMAVSGAVALLAVWATGLLRSTLPWPRPKEA